MTQDVEGERGALSARVVRKALNTDLPFAALPAIAELRADLDEVEERAIATARAHGASWSDIAEALGVTRQALQQRVSRRALGKRKPGPAPREPRG